MARYESNPFAIDPAMIRAARAKLTSLRTLFLSARG
jgi:hypothetical protein